MTGQILLRELVIMEAHKAYLAGKTIEEACKWEEDHIKDIFAH